MIPYQPINSLAPRIELPQQNEGLLAWPCQRPPFCHCRVGVSLSVGVARAAIIKIIISSWSRVVMILALRAT